jgi:hypothetical protein
MGRASSSDRSGQSSSPQAEPSGQLCQAGAFCCPWHSMCQEMGSQHAVPRVAKDGTGLTLGLVKRYGSGMQKVCPELAESQRW